MGRERRGIEGRGEGGREGGRIYASKLGRGERAESTNTTWRASKLAESTGIFFKQLHLNRQWNVSEKTKFEMLP